MIMAGPPASALVLTGCKIIVALASGKKPLVRVSKQGLMQTCVDAHHQ